MRTNTIKIENGATPAPAAEQPKTKPAKKAKAAKKAK